MDRHAAGPPDGLQAPLRRKPALIEGMAGLVAYPHQGPGKIALVLAGRDATVSRDAAAKRMRADVEPSMLKIEADARHQSHSEAALLLDRKGATGNRPPRVFLPRQRIVDQIGQELRNLIE